MTYPTRWQVPSNYSPTNDPDVFPFLIGQEFVANKSPKFPATIIKTAASGREVRCQMASQPTWDFKVSYEFLTNNPPAASDLQTLYAFFLSRNGQAQPFFYFDPFDNVVTAQQIGVGNGVTTAFQLVRSVGAGTNNAFVEAVYAALGPISAAVNGVPKYGPPLNNLLTYSQAFANAAWTKNTLTVADNSVVSPDGSTDAAVLTATGATSYMYQFIATDEPATVTGSVWLKVPTGTALIYIGIEEVGGGTDTACTLTTSWQRFFVSRSCITSSPNLQIGDSTFTTGMVIHAFGAQMEVALAPGPYQPTASLAGDFTINPYGVINFATPPASGPVAWSGQFLFLCRFAQDNLDTEQMMLNLWSQDGLAFTSFHP